MRDKKVEKKAESPTPTLSMGQKETRVHENTTAEVDERRENKRGDKKMLASLRIRLLVRGWSEN